MVFTLPVTPTLNKCLSLLSSNNFSVSFKNYLNVLVFGCFVVVAGVLFVCCFFETDSASFQHQPPKCHSGRHAPHLPKFLSFGKLIHSHFVSAYNRGSPKNTKQQKILEDIHRQQTKKKKLSNLLGVYNFLGILNHNRHTFYWGQTMTELPHWTQYISQRTMSVFYFVISQAGCFYSTGSLLTLYTTSICKQYQGTHHILICLLIWKLSES